MNSCCGHVQHHKMYLSWRFKISAWKLDCIFFLALLESTRQRSTIGRLHSCTVKWESKYEMFCLHLFLCAAILPGTHAQVGAGTHILLGFKSIQTLNWNSILARSVLRCTRLFLIKVRPDRRTVKQENYLKTFVYTHSLSWYPHRGQQRHRTLLTSQICVGVYVWSKRTPDKCAMQWRNVGSCPIVRYNNRVHRRHFSPWHGSVCNKTNVTGL